MKKVGSFLCAALLLAGVFAVGCRAIVSREVPLREMVYAITLRMPARH